MCARVDRDLARGSAAVALLLCLPSCGTRTSDAAPPGSPPPRTGGDLRLAQQAPKSLDPVESDSVYESLPINQIFDGLVDVDSTLSFVPSLARTWTISRDGKTYTFRLRPGVRFHDGSDLTADDVVFTLRRLLSPGRAARNVACSYLSVVTGAPEYQEGASPDLPGVTAVDPLTIRIDLHRPYPSFLEVLAMDGLRIVPKEAVTRMGEERFRRSPVGTGPFRLATWTDDRLILEANRDYFGQRASIDRVVIEFLKSHEADHGADRFHRGQLDVLQVAPGQLKRLSTDSRVRLYRYAEMSLSFLGLNTGEGFLDDVRIRKAIAHAVNRDDLVTGSSALYRKASGILPPGLTGYAPVSKALPFDPDRARILLAEAGFPGGRGLPPLDVFVAAGSPSAEAAIPPLKADLAAVGIVLHPHLVSWEELGERLDHKTAPAFFLSWIADLSDPDSFLRSLFESGGPANFFKLNDAETDRLLAEGASEMNSIRRARIYGRVEAHLLAIAPVIPLHHSVGMLALRRQVHGIEPGPLGLANVCLERVWFSAEETPL